MSAHVSGDVATCIPTITVGYSLFTASLRRIALDAFYNTPCLIGVCEIKVYSHNIRQIRIACQQIHSLTGMVLQG
jgi:hypothetical protein